MKLGADARDGAVGLLENCGSPVMTGKYQLFIGRIRENYKSWARAKSFNF